MKILPIRKKGYDRFPIQYYGGYIIEIPKPHIRYFDDGRYRPVEGEVTTWRGISFGARHWYASLREVENPIWNPVGGYPHKDPVWQAAWDDKICKGRIIHKDCESEDEAWNWIKAEFSRVFGNKTHRLVYKSKPRRRLPRQEGD